MGKGNASTKRAYSGTSGETSPDLPLRARLLAAPDLPILAVILTKVVGESVTFSDAEKSQSVSANTRFSSDQDLGNVPSFFRNFRVTRDCTLQFQARAET